MPKAFPVAVAMLTQVAAVAAGAIRSSFTLGRTAVFNCCAAGGFDQIREQYSGGLLPGQNSSGYPRTS
jgi:hypothetical protein